VARAGQGITLAGPKSKATVAERRRCRQLADEATSVMESVSRKTDLWDRMLDGDDDAIMELSNQLDYKGLPDLMSRFDFSLAYLWCGREFLEKCPKVVDLIISLYPRSLSSLSYIINSFLCLPMNHY